MQRFTSKKEWLNYQMQIAHISKVLFHFLSSMSVCKAVCVCLYAQVCATVAIYSQPPSCKHLLFKFTHLIQIELLKLFSI